MKPNRDIAVGKKGMIKDVHPSNLGEQEYTHAENTLTESQDGDALNLQNEDSNILCSALLAGFYVIGFQRDVTADRTYLFLTNPTTGQSEIGYIPEQEIQQTFTDTIQNSTCDCDASVVLADGLENIDQIATCTYTTLVSDYNCDGLGVGTFTFSVDGGFSVTPAEVNVIASGDVDNSGASGTGVSFQVITTGAGTAIASITVVDQGIGYQVGDVIVIAGDKLTGGTTPADDITITITANNCLNFNVNYPISSVLKDEKCGKVLYFTDDLNNRRRLEINKAEDEDGNYYYKQTVDCDPDVHPDCDCGTREESTCMNCDRLQVLPNNEPFCFDLSTENGGNVRHGNYAFFGGYCDSQGNLMTNILTSTGMVSIKNKNKDIYQQPELDEQTNLAIKLEVSNLDLSFDYYKVIVLQISSVDGANSFYTVGIYPTSNNTVTFTGENNLQRSDINEVATFLPDYTKAKTVEQADNTLYFSDLEATPDPNLQPVVNFIGQFAKWRTVTANEDLYADGRGTALFLGYMRDEVVPFSIRFKTNTGYVTPNYPLIGRHIETREQSLNGGVINTGKEDVLFESIGGNTDEFSDQTGIIDGWFDPNNPVPPNTNWETDVYSILNTSSSFCTPSDRNQKWQYYNTACPASAGGDYVFTNFGAADVSRSSGTHSAITPSTSGSGTGMILDVRVDANGLVYTIDVVSNGTGYVAGDTLTIDDLDLGGGGAADYTFDIAYVTESTQDLWQDCTDGEIETELKEVTRSCTHLETQNLPNITSDAPIIIEDPSVASNLMEWFEVLGEAGNLPDGYILGYSADFATSPASPAVTANQIIIVSTNDSGVSTSGSGINASFKITINGAGTLISDVEMLGGGSGFATSEVITIDGTLLNGGSSTTHDIEITVSAIGNFQELYDDLRTDPSTGSPYCCASGSPCTYDCDPDDLFDNCSSITLLESTFILQNLTSSTGDSFITEEEYLDCSERDTNGSSIHYPRLPSPTTCNSFYVPFIDSDGNTTGNNLNYNGSYDFWLKRADGTGLTSSPAFGSECDAEDFPCSEFDSSNNLTSGCEGVGNCNPKCKHPAYYERVANFLGNTSRGNAYSVNPSSYGTINYSFKIIPYFDSSTSSATLCDRTTAQSDNIYLTTISAVSDTLTSTELISFVNNDANSPNTQLAKDSVCGKNCGYDQDDTVATFESFVHRNAVWYQVQNIDTDSLIINVSSITNPDREFKDCLVYSKFLRLSVYDSSGNQLGVNGNSASTIALIDLYGNTEGDGVFCVDTTGLDEIYFAIDAPLIEIDSNNGNDCHDTNKYLTGTQNCLDLGVYAPTLDRLIIYEESAGTFSLRGQTVCTYTADCDLPIDDYLSCDPYVQDEGCFAFWQSTETYPNNNELWNSKEKIGSVNLTTLPNSIRYEFERLFTDSNGTLTEEANFTCKPIRHFKFPDFKVNPFFNTDTVEGQKNKIHPIGIWIDNEVIEYFLDVAVDNDLISQEFRDTITHYELFRGDTKLNKSIVAKGLTYDMYSYTEKQNEQKTNWFSNFPYNDLSENTLLYSDETRTDFIDHPSAGESGKPNNRFTFHSPETHYEKPNLGFEYYFESYFKGHSRGVYSEVSNHPTMTILTQRAFRLSTILAITEIILDITTNTANFIKELTVGFAPNIGSGISVGIYTASAFGNAFAQGRARKQEWLNIFYNNANPNNFAHFYSSVGHYNDYQNQLVDQGNRTRGLAEGLYLKDGIYRINERGETLPTVINNKQRESSVYLYMLDSLSVESTVESYDKSRASASSYGCETVERSSTPEYKNFILSPYVSIKNYVPAQHGTINSIKWINTGYCGVLAEDNSCDVVFGGDTFISRFALKRKYPFFLNSMIDGNSRLPDLTPFIYSRQRNVGYPRYYVNYLATEEDAGNIFGISMRSPVASTEYEFDCLDITNSRGRTAMSVQSGSKFYLYYYGIPSFLVESRVNNNFRYGENETNKDFYPNQQDYVEWTQEKNVSIREDNYFFYNNIYSTENDITAYRTLPDNYDEDEWACRFDHWDRVIYSLPDNNEQDLLDNFRVFKANNYYDFGNKYGTFYGIKPLENEKVLALFENGVTVLNAFNTIEGSSENISVGQGNIFQNRPTTFFQTELGYGGTQHRAFVSCEYGHFWVDAKRGRVFHLQPNAAGLKEVSRNGMKNWFRENLPFRIKKDFPTIPDDMLDNAYDGIGITMVWDDRNSRLIITKKDYILKSTAPNELFIEDLDFYYYNQDDNLIKVDVTNTDYFEDCSWTVSYSPITETFISFHSYKPNYYIPYQNYFSSGLNTSSNAGIWNHLLGSNQTFQVYYTTLYPWLIELPIKKNFQSSMLEDISYRLDVRRYNNEYDYGYYKDNFDTAVIYNEREATGQLNLISGEANNLQNAITYPRQNGNSTDIIATLEDYTWSFNYLMDNLKDSHTLPIWNFEPNNVEKTLNNNAFDYRPTFKNHMRGQWYLVRLSQNDESRLKFIFEHLISEQKDYDAY